MCEKVGLRLFLIRVDGSDEDGAKIGGGCRCGGRLGHCDTFVSARNSEGDRGPVNVDLKSNSVFKFKLSVSLSSPRGVRHASCVLPINLGCRQFENRPKIDRLLTPSIYESHRTTQSVTNKNKNKNKKDSKCHWQIRDRATVRVG